jgi:hypothetical protein
MTKTEWRQYRSLYRRVKRMRSAWYEADKAHRKRPYKIADIYKLEASIPKDVLFKLFDADFKRGCLRDGAENYRWRTAAYSSTPWFESQSLPYATASHNSRFVLTCSLKRYCANVREWRAREHAPMLSHDIDTGLAPTIEKCA